MAAGYIKYLQNHAFYCLPVVYREFAWICALQQVSHGAIQFTAYEELRKTIVDLKSKGSEIQNQNPDQLLVS